MLFSQRDLAGAAGWSLLAAAVARAANLFALILCARVLTQIEFGHVGIIQSTVGMFAPLASLGLAMTSAKFIAQYRDTDPVRAGRILGLSLSAAALAGGAFSIVLVLLAPWLAEHGLSSPGLKSQLTAASGLLVLGVIESAESGALAGLSAFAGIARAGAWSSLASIPVIAVLAWTNGASGAILGLTISMAISCLVSGMVLRSECRRFGIRATLAGARSERSLLFDFSLPAYLSGLFVAPVYWLASALLVREANGFSEMGIFSAADRYRYLLIFVPLAISRIAVPALSRLHASGDTQGYRKTLRWNLQVALLSTALPALVCILSAAPLLSLFGSQYRTGWPVLVLLAISAIPTVMNTQLGAALLSEGLAWERAGADAVLAAVFLVTAWWAVPSWGAAGLAATFIIAYSSACLLMSIQLWRSDRAKA